MLRVNTPEGARLSNIGVSNEKFNHQNLPKLSEFQSIGGERACNLIHTIRTCETGDINEAFDIVLDLLRRHTEGFDRLCNQPDLVETLGIDIVYSYTDDNIELDPIEQGFVNEWDDHNDWGSHQEENTRDNYRMWLNGENNSDADSE